MTLRLVRCWCVVTFLAVLVTSAPVEEPDGKADNNEGASDIKPPMLGDNFPSESDETIYQEDLTHVKDVGEVPNLEDADALYLETPKCDTSTNTCVNDEPPEEEVTPDMADVLFEADIKLTEVQEAQLEHRGVEVNGVGKRKGIMNLANIWPKGIVPYAIDPSLPDSTSVLKAIKHWEYHTCIQFKPISEEVIEEVGHSDHLLFRNGTGFWSYVGRVGLGPQPVSIKDLSRIGSIAHEIGHAIGFWHEQARPDRDNYITVVFENIVDGAEKSFAKYDVDKVNTHQIPYDVNSIMQYGETFFSKNGKRTIETVDPLDQAKLGNRYTLSKYDIEMANKMYNCPDTSHCMDRHPACQNWSMKGYCEGRYSGYMLYNCAKSCDMCHECVDKEKQCNNWVKYGFCKGGKYEKYMFRTCRRACGTCVVFEEHESR